jgi:hypothetical protein
MAEIGVSSVSSYLADAGWFRTTRTWHGAAIWSNGSEEVLVPPRDGMGDSVPRLRELLQALENVESRSAVEIARDIAHPLLDSAYYRRAEVSRPDGFVSLPSGLAALRGVHDMFRAAAGTVLEAPRFSRGAEAAVSDLVSGIHLGSTSAHHFALTLLVPLGEASGHGPTPIGRQVLLRMHSATAAVRQAIIAPSPDAFDLAEAAGASADFCVALSTLAGEDLQEPFELGFRWARGVPSDVPDQLMQFPAGAGGLIRDGSRRVEQGLAISASTAEPEYSGPAIIAGRIEALHDNESGVDRWRVKVRGELRTDHRPPTRRTLWIRLPGQEPYDIALLAHRNHSQVRISGLWTDSTRPVRILADPDGLQIVGDSDGS